MEHEEFFSDDDSEIDFIEKATSRFVNDSSTSQGGNSVETSKDESISNMTNKSHDKKDRLVQQRIAQFNGVKTAGLKDFYVRSNDESEKIPNKKES